MEEYERRYSEWVRYAASMSNGEVAEDIVSDVVVSVIGSDVEVDDLNSYVRASIKNACIDWYRARGVEVALRDAPVGMDQRWGSAIAQYVHSLSDLAQEVLVARFVEGMSTQQVADSLGLSPASVKWVQWSGLEELRYVMGVPHASYGRGEVADRRTLVGELRSRGMLAGEIARQVGVSERTVWRDIRANKRGT